MSVTNKLGSNKIKKNSEDMVSKFSGIKLKEARVKKDLRLKDLADLMNEAGYKIKFNTISAHENMDKEPGANIVKGYSVVLEKTINYFYTDDPGKLNV